MSKMQTAAEIQAMLVGVPLPATRDELVEYARHEDDEAAGRLGGIEDRAYGSLDEVGEELARVQPDAPEAITATPREESGEPPGMDEYTNPHAQSGEPRRANADQAKQAIERASKLQKEQKAKQGSG